MRWTKNVVATPTAYVPHPIYQPKRKAGSVGEINTFKQKNILIEDHKVEHLLCYCKKKTNNSLLVFNQEDGKCFTFKFTIDDHNKDIYKKIKIEHC